MNQFGNLPPLNPQNMQLSTNLFGRPPAKEGMLQYPSLSTLIDALAKVNITKHRQYFLRQRVNLDGMHFEECRFDECMLYTDNGDIHLKNCVFGPGTVINFGANAKKIVQLASVLDPNTVSPELLAKLAKVGSVVSISVL